MKPRVIPVTMFRLIDGSMVASEELAHVRNTQIIRHRRIEAMFKDADGPNGMTLKEHMNTFWDKWVEALLVTTITSHELEQYNEDS